MISRIRRISRMPAAWAAVVVLLLVAAPVAVAAPLGQFAGTLTFTVDEMSPALVTASGPTELVISGTMTNTGDEELAPVVARIQRGPRLTSPAEVQAEIAEPSQPVSSWSAFSALVDTVDPGQTVPFQVTADIFGDRNAGLAVTEPGVYPIMINVNAEFESGPSNGARVGELHALLTVASVPADPDGSGGSDGSDGSGSPSGAGSPDDPDESGTAEPAPEIQPAPTAAQPLSLVLPLVDRPHRDATGAFFDDDLTPLISAGGRLEAVLSAAETSPLPPGALTLAVDPELVEELQLMSQGYTVGPYVFDLTNGATVTPETSSPSAVTSLPTATAPETSTAPGTSTSGTGTGTTPATTGTATTGAAEPGTGSGGATSTGSDPTTTGSTTSTASADTSAAVSADTSTATTTDTSTATSTGGLVPTPGPTSVPGTGATAAQAFLSRLRAVTAQLPTIVLPYSDIDAVAAVRAGHADRVTAAVTRGRTVAAQILGGNARLIDDISWPLDGVIDDPTLTVLRSAGLTEAILDRDGVDVDGTPTAAVVRTSGGEVRAVLSGTAVPAGALELNTFTAVTAQNHFSAVSTPTVLAPPRTWQPSEDDYPAVSALLVQLAAAGIVTGVPVTGLPAAASSPVATLDYPEDARDRELPAASFTATDDLITRLANTQTAFAPLGDVAPGEASSTAPTDLFASVADGLGRQAAGGYRYDLEAQQTSAAAVQAVIGTVQAGVSLILPTGLTLTSTTSPLLMSIRNDQPYTVHLRVNVDARDARRAGITVQDVGIQTIQPGATARVLIPAEVVGIGTLSVRVSLTTPGGVAWGPEETLQVRSTAYGSFTIVMIVIAGVVVVLTAAGRIRKRYRQRNERIEAGLQ